MNKLSVIFGIASLLSFALLIFVNIFAAISRRKNEPVIFPAAFTLLQPEILSVICLVFCFSFGIMAAYTSIDKCENCNHVVQSAYCVYCGEKNEGYVDNVSTLAGTNICPECQLPCSTPYCGDCGTQTIFVEE